MQLHQIKPVHKRKKQKRVGRAGAHGHYCCSGVKGKRKMLQPIIRESIKRYGKLRGYRAKGLTEKLVVLNLEILDKNFKSGETITPQILIEKKLTDKIKGQMPKIKILGSGDLKKSLIFEKCLVSSSAKTKIEKAGGQIK
jgi:large subunit ribosomal protein L15